MANLPLFDVPYMLTASKERAYRDHMIMIAQATASVFTAERLALTDLNARFRESAESFVVRIGELTPEGLDFARRGYQRWLENQDRWTTSRTLEKLEQSLRRQLARHRQSRPSSDGR